MTFSNHLCWNPQTVHEVIKVDAEAVRDYVFQAVHTDHPLLLSTTGKADHLTSTMGHNFLDALTDPARPEINGLVVGESGAGKTHFIHWLKLNIPRSETVRVVNIPKVGTSLRGILRLIIEQLPEASRARYEDQFASIGGAVNSEKQKQTRLINAIAQAIEARAEQGNEDSEEMAETVRYLPRFFLDTHIRENWLLADRPNNIIFELTQHVYESKRIYTRQEQDRHFKADDFRLPPGTHSNVAKETRDILDILDFDEFLQTAADITNDCLDTAIGDALSFSGDHLIELMAEVREHLHRQGLSLMIFIEDLSRMQGVDKALLQALTTPASQGETQLCEIRWVAAMTTDYYEGRLHGTLASRINLLGKVEADEEVWIESQAEIPLASFMSRYLNAVRLGDERLQAWNGDGPTPNACSDCPYIQECHNSFGEIEGVGMYPFTSQALLNMALRTKPNNIHWFNPRRLLKDIVSSVLSTHGPDIISGDFPRSSLIEEMGGKQLKATEEQKLRTLAGSNFDRHRTLQELWQPLNYLQAMPEGLPEAFNLEPLLNISTTPQPSDVRTTVEERPTTTTTKKSTSREKSAPELDADPILDKIREWGNGAPMDDRVAGAIRELVFNSIRSHADWDLAGVSDIEHYGSGKPLRATSIYFRNQTTQRPSHLTISLPLEENEENFNQAAIALQGLYLFKKHKGWTFPEAHMYLINSQSCLEKWSVALITALKDSVFIGDRWQTVDAATELLAIGAAFSGTIGSDKTEADLWTAMWGNGPATASQRILSPELKAVAEVISEEWSVLQRMVKSWNCGTKGGSTGKQLNPGQPLSILKRIKRNRWQLSMTPGQATTNDNSTNVVRKLYHTLAASLHPALKAEKEAYVKWQQDMENCFGSKSKSDIVMVFNHLQATLNDLFFLPNERERLQGSLEDFDQSTYDAARARAGLVEKESGKLAPYYFAKRGIATAMCTAKNFADESGNYLDVIESYNDAQMDDLGEDTAKRLQTCWSNIGTLLENLDHTLDELASTQRTGE